MRPVLEHPWDLDAAGAETLQRALAGKTTSVAPFDDAARVKTVAALDVWYGKGKTPAVAAVTVHKLPGLEIVESVSVRVPAKTIFPYVPGLFSFREIPPLLKALERLKTDPDVLLLDGHGRAHPRRFGLASHIGLLFDKPSIGCAEEWILGDAEEPPPGLAGGYAVLRHGDEPVGAALRTKPYARPLYVSPGHRMDLTLAVDIVMACVRGDRRPVPLIEVDRLSRGKVAGKKTEKTSKKKPTMPSSPRKRGSGK